MWTDCVGDCGTNGWRLLSENIDSGEGHGAIVDVNLYVRERERKTFLSLTFFTYE